jgi:photosystem II stability/assembly factor-like uncharacterized protein
MNRIRVVLLLVFITGSAYSQTWNWQNPYPQGNDLYAVHFWNAANGYAVGAFGTIIKTTDGGNTWAIKYMGADVIFRSVFATGPDTCYVTGNNAAILKTTNGGGTWVSLDPGTGGDLYSVWFADSNTGFVAGSDGTLLKTANAGASWTVQSVPASVSLRAVFFSGANIGYVVGDSGVILKTTNGGSSWSLQPFGPASLMLYSVYFVNDTIGWLGGWGQFLQSWQSEIFRTDNGGTTWVFQYAMYPSGAPTGLFFANKDTGLAVGLGIGFAKTTNGGQHWAYDLNPGFSFRSGCFTAGNTAFMVGDGGIHLMSNDAGNSWLSPHTATYNWLNSVSFPPNNNSIGYAAGDSGTVVKTTDGGADWTHLNTPTKAMLSSVRHEACVNINQIPTWMKEPCNQICRSG